MVDERDVERLVMTIQRYAVEPGLDATRLARGFLESRRVEPSADVVGTIRDVIARKVFAPGERISVQRVDHAARAVLSALAEMGDEAWPSVEETAERLHAAGGGELSQREAHLYAQEASDTYRSRLALVIAALRVELAAKGKRVAELEGAGRRLAGRAEPRPDDDPEGVAESFTTSALDK